MARRYHLQSRYVVALELSQPREAFVLQRILAPGIILAFCARSSEPFDAHPPTLLNEKENRKEGKKKREGKKKKKRKKKRAQ